MVANNIIKSTSYKRAASIGNARLLKYEHNYVSLTVTPEIEQYGAKRVVVSWQVLSTNPNDWVGVLGADPAHRHSRQSPSWSSLIIR